MINVVFLVMTSFSSLKHATLTAEVHINCLKSKMFL